MMVSTSANNLFHTFSTFIILHEHSDGNYNIIGNVSLFIIYYFFFVMIMKFIKQKFQVVVNTL